MPQLRLILVHKVGIDAIGQPAFFAHFLHEAAFEGTAAQDVIEDEGCKEIGIIPVNARLAEYRHGLRRGKRHDVGAAIERHPGRAGKRRACRRKVAQKGVEQACEFFRRDVTDGAHIDAVACKRALVRGQQVVAGQGAHGFDRAILRHAIGVVAIDHRIEPFACDGARVFFVRLQDRQQLGPHPRDRVLVKARGHKAVAQQRDGLIAVFRQELGRDPHRIVGCVIPERGGQRLGCLGKGARVQIACPFFQKRNHEAGRALLFRCIERGASAEPDLKRGEGDRMLLDQPGGDTAGRGDFLDGDFCARRQRGA